jgi:hypothetical protein
MSGLNKLAVFREFAFLSRYCDISKLNNACVKRFDEEILSIEEGFGRDERSTYLLNQQGGLIIQVGHAVEVSPIKPWTWRWFWFYRSIRGRTVLDSLHVLGAVTPRVHYIVDIHRGVLTLYKPPKGFKTIGNWLISRVEELKGQG